MFVHKFAQDYKLNKLGRVERIYSRLRCINTPTPEKSEEEKTTLETSEEEKTTLETSEAEKTTLETRNEWKWINYTINEWSWKNYTPNECRLKPCPKRVKL